MPRLECCDKYRETEFNYCPECGYALKNGDYHQKVEPTIIKSNLFKTDNKYRETHPSYGQLSFSRRTSDKTGAITLYGSSVRHQNTITMTVVRSDKYCNEFNELFFGHNQPLIEVEMSQSQFSEAITSMNIGSGVPVTLKTIMGRIMPDCLEKSIRQKADENLKTRFNKIAKRLKDSMDQIEEITNQKGTIKKADKATIRKKYEYFITEISSNLPFLKECIDELVDDSIKQAKDEVEAFWLNKINSLGIDKLSELANNGEFKMIEDK